MTSNDVQCMCSVFNYILNDIIINNIVVVVAAETQTVCVLLYMCINEC